MVAINDDKEPLAIFISDGVELIFQFHHFVMISQKYVIGYKTKHHHSSISVKLYLDTTELRANANISMLACSQ